MGLLVGWVNWLQLIPLVFTLKRTKNIGRPVVFHLSTSFLVQISDHKLRRQNSTCWALCACVLLRMGWLFVHVRKKKRVYIFRCLALQTLKLHPSACF